MCYDIYEALADAVVQRDLAQASGVTSGICRLVMLGRRVSTSRR